MVSATRRYRDKRQWHIGTSHNMNTLEIYGRHTSYNVQKVLWLADELKLKYRHTEIGGRFGGTDSADFLQMNPLGKVPVLRHGQQVVWESNTIVRYLAGLYGGDSWMASTPFAKSLGERWMDWSIEKLEPAFVGVFWGFYRTPPEQRDLATIDKHVHDCETCLKHLGEQLGDSHFLLGSTTTVADIATGVYLHRLWSIELTVRFPDNIHRWYRRLSEQAGYQRWVMSDFTELKGRSSY